MDTIPIYLKLIDPKGKKINVIQHINKNSQAPISSAFYNYIEGKEHRYQYQLIGEGAW